MQTGDADLASGVRALLDESAVRAVVSRYAAAIDWMNWPEMEACFWSDAAVDFGDMFRGSVADFMPFVIQLEGGYIRRLHLLGIPRIVLDGSEADVDATSITCVRTLGESSQTDSVIYGRYRFRMQKRGEEWRMARLYFMLNAFKNDEGPIAVEGPINLGDHLSMDHAEAPTF